MCREVGAPAPRGPEPSLSTPAARALFDHAVRVLAGDVGSQTPLDARVAAVLRRLEGVTRLPPVSDLAAGVSLSPSRLQHLVRDHVGVSLGRWLLWRLQRQTA